MATLFGRFPFLEKLFADSAYQGPIFADALAKTLPRLEHVPKKLLDFFDQDMLQLFDFERVLIDQMIPFDRDAL